MMNFTKKRIVSLVLVAAMLLGSIPADTFRLFSWATDDSTTDTTVDADTLNENVGKQAVFDWHTDFLLVDEETLMSRTADEMSEYYGNSEIGYANWVLYDDLSANDLVLNIIDYHYDAENGFHWYKVGAREGETLPNALQNKPWVFYCDDIDVEDGTDPYLAIYDKNAVVRIVNPVINGYSSGVRFVLSGSVALEDAEIVITDHDEADYTVSKLAYVHEENGIWSDALNIQITKANGEEWSAADGNVGIRYTAEQIAISDYDDVCYGAAFLYIDGITYSANVTDKLGYDISDVVYTNSGSSVVVFELLEASFDIVNKLAYFKDSAITTTETGEQTVNMYDNTLTSDTFDFTVLPEYFTVEYKFNQTVSETETKTWYWISDGALVDPAYFLVSADDLAFVVSLENATGVTVTGKIPENAELVVTGPDNLSGNIPAYINDTWFKDLPVYSVQGYDISINDANGNKWQPADGDTVTVTIPDAWDPESYYHRADVYHVLDDDTQEVERFASVNGTVDLCADGSIIFETGSFSTFVVASGATTSVSITTEDGDNHTAEHKGHIVYLTKTGRANVSISGVNDLSGYVKIDDTSGGTILCDGSSANAIITAANASVGDSCIFKWTWTSSGETYTAEVLVVVVDDASKYTGYHDEVIHHIQLNIEQVAVLVNGTDVVTLDDVALGFTSSTTGTLVRVKDPDSAVGYYYTYTYNTPASGSTPTYDTTITIKLDETQTYKDSNGNTVDVSTLDFVISDVLLIAGSGSEQDQITFVGTFPKGVTSADGAVKYLLSVETSYYGSNTDFYGDRLSFSTSIGYWDDENVCPGKNTGNNPNDPNGGGGSGGIDVAKFSMGHTVGDTTYYVVYSDMTKIIKGDVLTAQSLRTVTKQFTFTVYRRSVNLETGETGDWQEFDTFTVTGDFTEDEDGSSISTTTIATVAEKYDPANLDGYQFMLVETGNTIDGYSCDVSYNKSNGIFTFDKVESTLTYSSYTYGSGDKTTTLYVYGTDTADTSDDTYKVVTTITSSSSGKTKTTTYESTFDSSKTHQSTTKTVVEVDGNKTKTSTSDSTWNEHVNNMYSSAKSTVGNKTFTGAGSTTEEENQTSGTIVYNATLSCTNTYDEVEKGLTVNKVVNGAGAPASEQFTVTITPTGSTSLGDDGTTYNYYVDGSTAATTATVKNGVITVTILGGQSLYFKDLEGSYKIQETKGNTTGFTYDTTPYTRAMTEASPSAAVTITNIFSADATKGSLKISKEVVTENDSYTKPTGDSRAVFTFNVTIGTANASYTYTVFESDGSIATDGAQKTLNLTGGVGEIQLKDGQYAVIDGITYETEYSVEEEDIDGYKLKESSGTEGAIVAGSTVVASFTNTYKNPLSTLTINKVVSGTKYGAEDTFIFDVYKGEQLITTVSLRADQSVTIGNLPIGTTYTVTERVHWRYTTVQYQIIDSKTTTGTGNRASVTIASGGSTVTFTNELSNDKYLSDTSVVTNKFTVVDSVTQVTRYDASGNLIPNS